MSLRRLISFSFRILTDRTLFTELQEGPSMSKNASEEGLKIYVTSRGGQYVKADELLASPKVREIIKKMADIPVERKSSGASPSK